MAEGLRKGILPSRDDAGTSQRSGPISTARDITLDLGRKRRKGQPERLGETVQSCQGGLMFPAFEQRDVAHAKARTMRKFFLREATRDAVPAQHTRESVEKMRSGFIHPQAKAIGRLLPL